MTENWIIKMRIAGFDPSLSNWGMCLAEVTGDNISICETGIVQTSKEKGGDIEINLDDLRRAKELIAGVTDFINNWKPTLIIAEFPHGSQSSRAMVSYAMCIAILAGLDIPVIKVTASDVKVAATGNTTAKKDEMIAWGIGKCAALGNLPKSKSEHIADSIAAVYAGVKTAQFKTAMAVVG